MRARAVRMIFEHEHEYANQSAAVMAIAPKIGCGRGTLRRWVKQSDINSDRKDGQTSDDRAKIKAMEREIRDRRKTQPVRRCARTISTTFETLPGSCIWIAVFMGG